VAGASPKDRRPVSMRRTCDRVGSRARHHHFPSPTGTRPLPGDHARAVVVLGPNVASDHAPPPHSSASEGVRLGRLCIVGTGKAPGLPPKLVRDAAGIAFGHTVCRSRRVNRAVPITASSRPIARYVAAIRRSGSVAGARAIWCRGEVSMIQTRTPIGRDRSGRRRPRRGRSHRQPVDEFRERARQH
jgi:hypothetical protein